MFANPLLFIAALSLKAMAPRPVARSANRFREPTLPILFRRSPPRSGYRLSRYLSRARGASPLGATSAVAHLHTGGDWVRPPEGQESTARGEIRFQPPRPAAHWRPNTEPGNFRVVVRSRRKARAAYSRRSNWRPPKYRARRARPRLRSRSV